MGNITAANAVFMLQIIPIFPAPQQLQGFSADDIFSTDPVEPAEIIMGVDGRQSAGFIFYSTKQSITLQADSPSCDVFDLWMDTQQSGFGLFLASGLVSLPAIGRKWTMSGGVLSTYPPMPDGGKTLKPRKFGLTWEKVQRAVI